MSFIDKAKEKAGELAHKAGPGAAKGVDSAKAQLDKATGGKYHDRIENVSGKVQDALKKAQGGNGQDSSGDGSTRSSDSSSTGPSQSSSSSSSGGSQSDGSQSDSAQSGESSSGSGSAESGSSSQS